MQWGFLSLSFLEILRLLVAFGRVPQPWLGFGRAPAGQGQRRGTQKASRAGQDLSTRAALTVGLGRRRDQALNSQPPFPLPPKATSQDKRKGAQRVLAGTRGQKKGGQGIRHLRKG